MEEGEERVFQEFAELQEKAMIQADMFGRSQQQERVLALQRQKCVLTKTELQGMPDQTIMYKSIGRAYFCCPKTEVVKELGDKVAHLEGDVKTVREQRDAIEKKMKDTDLQIRELINQSPTLIRRLGAVKIQ